MKTQFIEKKITYDDINDILYVTFANDQGNSYAEEEEQGIEIMHDSITDDVTGLMVFAPRMKLKDRQQKLYNLGYIIDLASFCQ